MLNFQLEDDASCLDWVEVRDGGDETSPLLIKACGTTLPNNIQSKRNKMFVHFHSGDTDWSNEGTGFSASFTTQGKK